MRNIKVITKNTLSIVLLNLQAARDDKKTRTDNEAMFISRTQDGFHLVVLVHRQCYRSGLPEIHLFHYLKKNPGS